MVTATFAPRHNHYMLLKYFVLSVAVNIVLMLTVQVGKLSQEINVLPMLKVNLMALAAPAILPVEKVITPPKPTPIIKKFVTAPVAKKHIAPAPQKTPEPIAEPKPIIQEPVISASAVSTNDIGKDTSTVIHEAQYRRQTPPNYPRRALELGQQGTVTIHAEILPNGTPRELKIVESSGHRLLDKAALAAVKKWEFEPTRINGNIVTSWARVPVKFIIQ